MKNNFFAWIFTVKLEIIVILLLYWLSIAETGVKDRVQYNIGNQDNLFVYLDMMLISRYKSP